MKITFIFLIAVLLYGCTAIRNSRDNKALSRVLTNPVLSDRTYAELVKQHPIKIDTVIRIVKGEQVVTYDTLEVPVIYRDTIIDEKPARIEVRTKLVTKYVTNIDTVFKILQDERMLDAANTRIVVLETQLKTSQDSDIKHTKGKRNWIFAAIGLALLLLLGIVLVFKRKI